uniref:Family with sequence similarity 184 member B n=1 Tax=Varanus komodoensis TaxID=61221 RepID=A0A8D2J1Z2_VARKO
MASGINKKIHQPATCNGSSKTSHPCSSSDDCDQEMHMKMCKKIAQLTKVIYALNTKNDEYEASMQALKEAHQEEIQHILAETQETVLQYQNKVEEAQELQNYIQFLEEALKKHRQRKEEVSSEVTPCKKQIDEEELQIEAEQADDKLFQEMACTKLRVQASNKMSDGLVNKHVLFSGDTLNNKGKLTEMYSLDIQAVISETMNLKWENQKLAEEFAKKASQLETSHEREKENWRKAMQQSATDLCREWQQREMEQRKNYEAQEAASREQIGKLEADLEAKGQQINELKKYSQKLKDKLQDLETQLKEAQQMATESKSVRKTLEEECRVTKERLLLRENEILHKTGKFNLCTSWMLQEASLEEKSIKQQHKEGMHKIKHESAEENIHLKEQLVKGLEDLVKKHTLEIKSVQASMDAERKKLQKEVQIQLEELKRKYENEIRHLQKEKEAISEKLQDCSLEITLEKAYNDAKWVTDAVRNCVPLNLKVTELKQTLEQQANTFRDALKEQDLQCSKEKEKLLQDLQDTVKQSQDMKAQLEASHQRAIKLLEKSKNQELKAAECWKKEYNDRFKVQQESHSLEMQALEQKARKELHSELERIQKQQSSLIESLRMELSVCMTHHKEKEELKVELKNLKAIKKQQAKDLKDKHKQELDTLKQDHRKEIQAVMSDFSSSQALLHAKIASLENELKELEEKPRKREPRLEDLHLIGCLQDKLNEKEAMIKELTVIHISSMCFKPMIFNSILTIKQKKKMDEAPSRIVSVPNLASYAKSFLSGDLRPKRNQPQITKSASLDQNPGCVRVCYPPAQVLETKTASR